MKRIGIIAGLSFLAGALFFAFTFGYFQKSNNGDILSPGIVHAETETVSGLNFAPLVKKVRPAVVRVESETIRQRRRSFSGDDFFDRFFDVPRRGPERVPNMGSGFLISSNGYIITNNHVVDKAIKVRIITSDKKEYKAKIIGTDPKTDLALTRHLSPSPLPESAGLPRSNRRRSRATRRAVGVR